MNVGGEAVSVEIASATTADVETVDNSAARATNAAAAPPAPPAPYADGGGGPPECVGQPRTRQAGEEGECGEDNDCLAAWMAALCAGEIDRSSCSEDDNANIDDHLSRQCGGEH